MSYYVNEVWEALVTDGYVIYSEQNDNKLNYYTQLQGN